MKDFVEVYIGIGSNIGDSLNTIKKALNHLSCTPSVLLTEVSRFYTTTPVSDIPQKDYINAVCCIKTTLSPHELYQHLQNIETKLGKVKQQKNAPRTIDLDILFYGSRFVDDDTLRIPHPRWKERLFVLIPLADIVDTIWVADGKMRIEFNIKNYLINFPNIHQETVIPIEGETCVL